MDARKLKEGELKRFKSGLLSNKWKDCHVALFSDSTLAIYDKKGDSRPIEQFFLKDIAPYICVGLMTDRMPTKRPDLPTGASVHHLVGFGQDPKAEKVTWLLFGSDSDLESWFNSITQTLPKPQNPPSAPAQQPGTNPNQPLPNQPLPASNQGGYVPPAQYPSGPKNYYPQNPNNGPPQQVYNNGPPSNNQQPYYQGQQPQSTHTTVIVDRDRSYGGGYSSGSSGLGFGSGALLGGLMGYGIGSFFTPSHYYGGGFGGFGLGHGFGGGYPMGGMGGSYPIGGSSYSTQDNDTYNVTNNYYNNDNDHNSQPQDNYNNDSQSQDNYNNSQDNNYQDQDNYQDDYQDQDDGDDQGGDFDAGGEDFDGGDW
ncbi:PH domain-containing protein [Aphelenchoides bicaudatus]|nr:PH domain-containing protein [Aphelenchoides bicaudatus]